MLRYGRIQHNKKPISFLKKYALSGQAEKVSRHITYKTLSYALSIGFALDFYLLPERFKLF